MGQGTVAEQIARLIVVSRGERRRSSWVALLPDVGRYRRHHRSQSPPSVDGASPEFGLPQARCGPLSAGGTVGYAGISGTSRSSCQAVLLRVFEATQLRRHHFAQPAVCGVVASRLMPDHVNRHRR